MTLFILGVMIGISLAGTVVIGRRRREERRVPASAPAPPPTPRTAATASVTVDLTLANQLPTFAAVGDLDSLKEEMRSTIGLLMSHPKEAKQYRVTWNGLLFHGPPGVGKSFFVQALAGEFGANLIRLTGGDLSTVRGAAASALVDEAFRAAAAHLPCVVFFDELDSVAGDRDSDTKGRDVVTALMAGVDEHRDNPQLLVTAAANAPEDIDAALVRPGRFDRHIRLDLPDAAARKAIVGAALRGRPVAKEVDLDELAERMRGQTPAAVAQVVELAALAAFREAAGTGRRVRITTKMLLEAAGRTGGTDRPMVEDWSWDRLVLPPETLTELREFQTLLLNPEHAAKMGIDPPAGVMLVGPPGTGKTTIAKVLAAESRCSFYPVSAADLTSKWIGSSERRVARLFARARANAPSIIFIDEIDAIGSGRGDLQTYDRQLDQLLAEIDGMRERGRVLVVGATNRPEALDPALLRGGRLSRIIEIPLPDVELRRQILDLLTGPMPLAKVDLDDVALETEGFSGGDLKALCQQSAVEAMMRHRAGRERGEPNVLARDFDEALTVERESAHFRPRRRTRDESR
jgi:transitional endoplasmic reticulum ATPase